MPPSIPSFLRARSLSSTRTPHPIPPHESFERIDIATIDTPAHSLRSEILIGFHPVRPHSLVTLSRPTKSTDEPNTGRTGVYGSVEIGLWDFHPGQAVRFLRRLSVEEYPDYLPVASVSTCFCALNETYYQCILRSTTDEAYGEGCVEVRVLPLGGKPWSVWESVTEEGGMVGGVCWNLVGVKGGCMAVSTASRVYFFSKDTQWAEVGEEFWSLEPHSLVFEVDVYLQSEGYGTTTCYATRLVRSEDKTISVLVFVSQKTQLQMFRLELCPWEQRAKVCAKTGAVQWKSGVQAALTAWTTGRKMMAGHVCEDECGEKRRDERLYVQKSWFARGQRGSLKQLVWEYGGIIVDGWNK